MRIILILLATLLTAPASANGSDGIGFVQLEEGTFWCRGGSAAEALSCAREKCLPHADGQECSETAWCLPARWSGLLTVWLDDFHTTQVICGAPSRKALTEMFRAVCAESEHANSCDFSTTIDPDGTERDDADETFPGPTAAQ
jgi:hypothetical protein